MTDKFKVCDKTQSEYLDKTFPHEGKGTWYDITDMLTQCDIVESCEECQRYGDDCDGDKRIEPTIEHDREWIIGCIKHDGFIKTDRFDKANQIILDALADRPSGVWIWCGDKGDSRFMCSVCKGKENVPTCMGEPTIWDYCPSCGARMTANLKEKFESADAVSREEYEELYHKAEEVNRMANEILADFPSYKELVSVVRCKDCMWEFICQQTVEHANADAVEHRPLEWCSFGERREP